MSSSTELSTRSKTVARQEIDALQDGDPVDECYLLVDKQIRANRNASLYLSVDIRDRTGLINARLWNVSEESVAHVNPGDLVRVKGKVQLFQGTRQIILTHIDRVSAAGMDLNDFLPQPTHDSERLLARLREILLGIDDPAVRTLMECFLVDESLMTDLGRAPAGVKAHHAYHGGLVEHIVNMLETAVRISDLYPQVDLNLLLAGIFLHDLGKVRELGFETTLVYSDEGQLIGHMMIGVEMLNEKIAQYTDMTGETFPQETALRIKHMIVSHHGSYEHGSSRLPMTPEAIALHYLDNLDAKVHEFARDIANDANTQSHWTPFNPRIDRKLFKGSSGDLE